MTGTVRDAVRLAPVTVTRLSTGEVRCPVRRRQATQPEAPLAVTRVPSEVLAVARRICQPGQRIRVLSGTAVIIENITIREGTWNAK